MPRTVLSARMIRKQKRNNIIEKNAAIMRFNPLSLLLTIFALMIEVYLIIKYGVKESTIIYSYILFALGLSGFIGIIVLNKGDFLNKDFPIKNTWSGLRYLLGIFGLVAIISIMMFIVRTQFRFAFELLDVYFYYLAAAICEEVFFRMFLINLSLNKIPNKIMAIAIGVLGSSTLFMIAHYSAYGQDPSLMLSMFLGGLIFSAYFLYFKDITITMVGHLLINLIVVYLQYGNILVQVY